MLRLTVIGDYLTFAGGGHMTLNMVDNHIALIVLGDLRLAITPPASTIAISVLMELTSKVEEIKKTRISQRAHLVWLGHTLNCLEL